jgi:hypothetical protein
MIMSIREFFRSLGEVLAGAWTRVPVEQLPSPTPVARWEYPTVVKMDPNPYQEGSEIRSSLGTLIFKVIKVTPISNYRYLIEDTSGERKWNGSLPLIELRDILTVIECEEAVHYSYLVECPDRTRVRLFAEQIATHMKNINYNTRNGVSSGIAGFG